MNAENEIIDSARKLLSGSFQGILSTHSIEFPGYPIGSLLPYSLDRHGWPLLLISHLAKHTRNLNADPRCSLTVAEQSPGETQTLTRLCCLADANPVWDLDMAAAERHFRYFPESRTYYRELNFNFYRLQPVRFYCVAGFGAARWISTGRMEEKNPFTYEEEDSLLADINRQFGVSLNKRLALPTDPEKLLPAVGLDATGLDLRQHDRLLRLTLPAAAASPQAFLSLLAETLQHRYP